MQLNWQTKHILWKLLLPLTWKLRMRIMSNSVDLADTAPNGHLDSITHHALLLPSSGQSPISETEMEADWLTLHVTKTSAMSASEPLWRELNTAKAPHRQPKRHARATAPTMSPAPLSLTSKTMTMATIPTMHHLPGTSGQQLMVTFWRHSIRRKLAIGRFASHFRCPYGARRRSRWFLIRWGILNLEKTY